MEMRAGVDHLGKYSHRQMSFLREILKTVLHTARRLRKNSNVVHIFCCGKASYDKKKQNRPVFFSFFLSLVQRLG